MDSFYDVPFWIFKSLVTLSFSGGTETSQVLLVCVSIEYYIRMFLGELSF